MAKRASEGDLNLGCIRNPNRNHKRNSKRNRNFRTSCKREIKNDDEREARGGRGGTLLCARVAKYCSLGLVARRLFVRPPCSPLVQRQKTAGPDEPRSANADSPFPRCEARCSALGCPLAQPSLFGPSSYPYLLCPFACCRSCFYYYCCCCYYCISLPKQ